MEREGKRTSRIHLNCRKSLHHPLPRPLHHIVRPIPAYPSVHAHPVADFTAEELEDGDVEFVAFDVPEGDVEAGEGGLFSTHHKDISPRTNFRRKRGEEGKRRRGEVGSGKEPGKEPTHHKHRTPL